MDNCRICLKYNKNCSSIYDTANGITYLAMMNSFANINVQESNFPERICTRCRKKLIEAYEFKVDIENSENILNNTANIKKIRFNNVNEILNINIDCKPKIPVLYNFIEEFMLNNEPDITYNNTLIKKIKDTHTDAPQTIREILCSVKFESGDDSDERTAYDDYDIQADPDYEYDHKKKNKSNSGNKNKSKSENNVPKPIKPVLITDLRVIRHSVKKKKSEIKHQVRKRTRQVSVCPYCGKLLQTLYLETHILQHNTGKPFKCDNCPKTFVKETLLNSHKKICSQPAKFKCTECIACFKSKPLLQAHILVHSEEKTFICDICNKSFKRRNNLQTHIQIHNFGKKSVQCQQCPMSFNSRYRLNNHMRVHTRERPYNCQICSQMYGYKFDFNRHCLKKHGVFLKRRKVYVMNEEVMKRETALMMDLALRGHCLPQDSELPSEFEGPLGAMAFKAAMKAIEARQIPVTCVNVFKNQQSVY